MAKTLSPHPPPPRATTTQSRPPKPILAALAALVTSFANLNAAARPLDCSDPGLADFLCPALVDRSLVASTSASAKSASALLSVSVTAAAQHPVPEISNTALSYGSAATATRARNYLQPSTTHSAAGASTSRRSKFEPRSKRKNRRDGTDVGGTYYYFPALYTSRAIPDRYELGTDGRWHKVVFLSSCSLCSSVDVNNADLNASETISAGDLAASSSASAPTVTIFSSTTASFVYPDGWESKGTDTGMYRVPLILVASLLLAAAITCTGAVAVYWRQRRRAAQQAALKKDIERMKRDEGRDGRSEGESEDGYGNGTGREGVYNDRGLRERTRSRRTLGKDSEQEKEKAKARLARATARWKAHVHWNHRRRRGRTSIVESMKQRDASTTSIAATSAVTLDATSSVSASFGTDAEASVGDRARSGEEGAGEHEEGGSSVGRRSSHSDRRTSTHSPARRDEMPAAYDRPPLDADIVLGSSVSNGAPLSEREDDVQGPPAYRSRWRGEPGNDDDEVRSRARRTRREEKSAAPGYVAASCTREDYVLSDDNDGDDEGEGEDEGRAAGLHVAIDDKRELARMAEFASAPPPSSSSPAPYSAVLAVSSPSQLQDCRHPPRSPSATPPSIRISESVPAPASAPGSILAPTVPAWTDLEEFADFAVDFDSDGAQDSPGAGPGPSTATARFTSPGPDLHLARSPHHSPRSLRSRSRSSSPSPVPSSPPFSPFPAPPEPIASSVLAYAPLPPGNMYFSYFAPTEAEGGGAARLDSPSAPPLAGALALAGIAVDEGDVLAGASAPPLFPDSDYENGAEDENCDDAAEPPAASAPPDGEHVETADRNAVLSAVR